MIWVAKLCRFSRERVARLTLSVLVSISQMKRRVTRSSFCLYLGSRTRSWMLRENGTYGSPKPLDISAYLILRENQQRISAWSAWNIRLQKRRKRNLANFL